MTIFQSSRHIADTITKNCTGPTLLLLSGGSSAKIAVKVLQLMPPEILNNITVTLSDERYVDTTSPNSNWNLLEGLGLSAISVKKLPVLRTPLESREATAVAFSQALADAQTESQFTVTILGIGTDNHTAGILPNTAAAHSTEPIVTNYATDAFERISITPAFFESIDYAFLYAEGSDKRTAVELLNSELDPISYPSQLIKRTKSYEVLYNEEAL
jgi:6-phosphogluconolactonase/glucosamine-6-phosphate isomerase/deaminase